MSIARRLANLERRPVPASHVVAVQVRQAFNGHAGAMSLVAPRMRKAVISAVAAGARDTDALARAVPTADPELAAALAPISADARKAAIQAAEERFGAPMGMLAERLIDNLAGAMPRSQR